MNAIGLDLSLTATGYAGAEDECSPVIELWEDDRG